MYDTLYQLLSMLFRNRRCDLSDREAVVRASGLGRIYSDKKLVGFIEQAIRIFRRALFLNQTFQKLVFCCEISQNKLLYKESFTFIFNLFKILFLYEKNNEIKLQNTCVRKLARSAQQQNAFSPHEKLFLAARKFSFASQKFSFVARNIYEKE